MFFLFGLFVLSEIREQTLKLIYSKYSQDCIDNEKLHFSSKFFNDIVEEVFKNLVKDKQPSNKPTLIKLGGQSGTGKTTQLMPAIKSCLDEKNISYIHMAVRLFAVYHPDYNKLLKEYGQSLIREKTNGFAVLCLFAILEKLIKNRYNILYEITLLDPIFEEYTIKISKLNNYKIIYNVISSPLEISNKWLNERTINSKIEPNRIVSEHSISNLYNILPKAIEHIIKLSNCLGKNDYMILWNLIEKEPILVSNQFNQQILELFNKNRIFDKKNISKLRTEKDALKDKISFYKKFFIDFNF